MTSKLHGLWFGTMCVILVLAGVVFAFFGLSILPVERSVVLKWGSSLYGSIMVGWGTTLLLLRRFAFKQGGSELARAITWGLSVWLLVEAAFSVYWRVWFNGGVDMVVLVLFLVPLNWKSR